MSITKRQQSILDFIDRYVDEHGYAPSIREIGAALGIASTSNVAYHLAKLSDQGVLERGSRGHSRGIRRVGARMVKPGDLVTVDIDGDLVEAPYVAP